MSVRFGNVLGSTGSVVPIFQEQLENGEPITITHPDMTRFFMAIPEAAWLILDAAALGTNGDLFVLDMGEPVRIMDLARDLVRLGGRDPESQPFEIVGLRPGEKLHEELFYDAERVEQTASAKVLKARCAASARRRPRARAPPSRRWPAARTSRLSRGAPRLRASRRRAAPRRGSRGGRGRRQARRPRPGRRHPAPASHGSRRGDEMTAGEASPFLPFARPSITEREKQAVIDVLDSGWLTTGARAKEFEQRFAETVGARHAVALNSATAALHLSLEALGVGPDDEVIVPTWTFAASAEVVAYRGARPVLVDVDRRTLNATPEAMLAAVTPRTRAVVAVHVAGLPVEIERLVEELEPRGIAVVEDAAHAFPCRLGGPTGRYVGTVGRTGAFSFYATKTITTGEGGMLVTDDEAIATRARVMSLHGISRDAWNRYTANGSWYYEIEDAGYKYNMTDIAAALGLVQLDRAHELLAARRELAAAYSARLGAAPFDDLVELPADAPDGSHAWHLYIVRLALDRLRVGRDTVIEGLKERGIGTSVHFIPLHLHPYYRRRWGYAPADLPVAASEYERVISLPIWPGMTGADVDRVVDGLAEILIAARRRR